MSAPVFINAHYVPPPRFCIQTHDCLFGWRCPGNLVKTPWIVFLLGQLRGRKHLPEHKGESRPDPFHPPSTRELGGGVGRRALPRKLDSHSAPQLGRVSPVRATSPRIPESAAVPVSLESSESPPSPYCFLPSGSRTPYPQIVFLLLPNPPFSGQTSFLALTPNVALPRFQRRNTEVPVAVECQANN